MPGYLEEACGPADLVQFRTDGPGVSGDVNDWNARHGGSPHLPFA